MRKLERELAWRRLDFEMRSYRQAGKAKNPTNDLLRAVRQALHIPVAEIAGKMGVNRSAVFELEAREVVVGMVDLARVWSPRTRSAV